MLRQYRDEGSAQLDGEVVRPRGSREDVEVPPFVRWPDFYRFMLGHWQAGEHMSLVGQTGSGKSTAMRELLDIRDYVVVIANKVQDSTLYGPLQARGYVMTDQFDPATWNVDKHPKVMFYCPLKGTSRDAEEKQADAIRQVLNGIYTTPGWTVALDEVAYLAKDLKLDRELNRIWREGRSAGTTVVAGTQRPVNVPRNMWEMATHNLDWRISGEEDRKTASGYLGDMQGVARETMAKLPKHEFLYVDSVEGIAMRSKVELTE